MSAAVRLAKIKTPADVLPEGTFAVMLDIDVFNLLVRDAPAFGGVAEWLDEAHEVENAIFEGCITPKLRATFGAAV